VPGSPEDVFDRISQVRPPRDASVVFDRACVLGGSVAGLLAARVLADHAREVLVIERDQVDGTARPRAGVPQDRQAHALLPGGLAHLERWLPGFAEEIERRGGVRPGPGQWTVHLDGQRQASPGDVAIVMGTRPFIETGIRDRVLALPNVSTLRAPVTDLRYRGNAVCAVRYTVDGVAGEIDADFVVDAMGRASRLSDWVGRYGYDRPRLERVRAGIGYATAVFERAGEPRDLASTSVIARFSPSSEPDGVAAAVVNAVEDQQWLVTLMTYGVNLAGRSMDAFRSACAKLPPAFGQASGSSVTRDVMSYHLEDSRRRDFTGLTRFPARLVSVGDAVASFNPIYAQGMTVAGLHAACLSAYLTGAPDLDAPASGFFESQRVVVDAAWTMSTEADAARRDAVEGAAVPAEVRRRRWEMDQLLRATVHDQKISAAFNEVAFMLRHPLSLSDPALVERAVAVNERAGAAK
jgi:2-polyprenyl-6-methoxyphenol hydroxylase-like FAD-dependent oxidoreductase